VSRRSGLGRGLAALIPPSEPPREDPDAQAERPASDPGDDAGAPPDAPPIPAAEQDGSGSSAPSDPPTGRAPTAPSVTDGPPPADPPGAIPGHAPDQAHAPGQMPGHSPSQDPGASSAPLADHGPGDEALPDVPAVTTGVAPRATLAEVSPSDIIPNPRQPREVFDEAEIEGLAVSLLDVGVLQPLVVRPLDGGRYELVAGERRLRAAKVAGLELIPVVVRHTEDADLLKEALVENIHRVQLNPLEEAAAYQQLLEEFGFTQEELASRIGKSRPAISNSLRLLSLPTGVQRRVAANVLSAGHAKALLALPDPAAQERLAERVVAEGLSVRAVEELVRMKLLDEPGGGGGASPAASSGSSKRRIVAPGLIDLQDDLSDALESRVRITMGARRGKLTIEFASVDDLERIVGVIAGGLESGGGAITMPSDEL
jgi:ParB family transcriptional regulator, chromosome partitioning protein